MDGTSVVGSVGRGCGGFEDMTVHSGVHVRHQSAPFGGDGSSVAAADLDGDGDMDLIFTQGMNSPARIYSNDGRWHFSAVDGLTTGVGIGVGDLDGDSDLDLVLTDMGLQHVLENLGDMGFRDRTMAMAMVVASPGGLPEPATGVLVADLDLDGDLDLYFAQRERSRVFRNDGGWRFTEVTDSWGIPARNASLAYVPSYFDASGDGVPDLFVQIDTDATSFDVADPAPEQPGNQLLVAQWGPGGFAGYRDEAVARGLRGAWSTMGVVAADFNGDNRLDLYLSNIGANPLFLARGDGTFVGSTAHREIAVTRLNDGSCAGLVRDRSCLVHSWGSTLFDADLDGDDDLFVAVNSQANDQGLEQFERLADGAWRRRPNCVFPPRGLGLISVDLDDDGDLDLVETTYRGVASVRRNNAAPSGRWLRVQLRGHRSNAQGVGATVTARRATGPAVTRLIGAHGCAYCTAPAEAWFTAAVDGPMGLDVRWPSGLTSHVSDVSTGQSVEIEEPLAP